ncbi:hypothetical protein EYM_06135 [Ignicoccus islandicus DSM 13165]|uniref:NAD-dependent epimerase/dehydratase domain-containing protein n=1 Tax=Ignicoccus islandicus DSM 13165 TaxID=940295 RepID=A0A0U2WNX2_9CREN|nr:NAD-dependent epimerase/dehydratase family protein [Ignicoccus islandicus]ALU12657.1 hypothetical protein EYM_06135 [Ignicoccus islandicus DSM 13165]
MKYAVIGAWGYLGANLLNELPSCGIARKSSAERRPFLKEAFNGKEMYLLNEIAEEELKDALERCGADSVIYAIGKLRGNYDQMKEAHVDKALLSLRVAKELGLKSFVYVSSVLAMGIAEKCKDLNGVVTEEESHLEGCEPIGNFSITKAMGEAEIVRNSEGITVGIIRPALIVGKWAYHPEWKYLNLAKSLGLPTPNLSASTINCIVQGIEVASTSGGWYLTVDGSLKELGFRAFDVKVPLGLIKAAPDSLKPLLLALRYKYASRLLPC